MYGKKSMSGMKTACCKGKAVVNGAKVDKGMGRDSHGGSLQEGVSDRVELMSDTPANNGQDTVGANQRPKGQSEEKFNSDRGKYNFC